MRRRDVIVSAAAALAGTAWALPAEARIPEQPLTLGSDDFRFLPLRVHLLRSKSAPELNTTLKEADVRRVLRKVNTIWWQAGIQFYLEALLSEEAANQPLYTGLGENRTEAHLRLVRPAPSRSDRTFHLYFIGRMRPNGICLNSSYELLFIKETASLHPVAGGADEPLPRVSAHEIGHALGLEHRQDTFNLMASGTTGTLLNEPEIRSTRSTAEGFAFCLKPSDGLAYAERLEREEKPAAKELYAALAALPGGDVARAARERLRNRG
jgi:hypothetical protein